MFNVRGAIFILGPQTKIIFYLQHLNHSLIKSGIMQLWVVNIEILQEIGEPILDQFEISAKFKLSLGYDVSNFDPLRNFTIILSRRYNIITSNSKLQKSLIESHAKIPFAQARIQKQENSLGISLHYGLEVWTFYQLHLKRKRHFFAIKSYEMQPRSNINLRKNAVEHTTTLLVLYKD